MRDRGAKGRSKGPPAFSPDSQSLVWVEYEAASGGRPPADFRPIRIVVQRITEDAPKEVLRAGGEKEQLASVCWSPDSRSLVLHIQGGSRRATDARFEVYDLKGRRTRTIHASGVPDASTHLVTFLVDCR